MCLPTRRRFCGNLFYLRRLQAKSRAQADVLHKLFYADGLAENAKTETKMQLALDLMSQACDRLGSHSTGLSPSPTNILYY